MDPLAQLIHLVRPRSLGWTIVEAWGCWAIRYPAVTLTVFGLVEAGRCWAEYPGRENRALAAGDYVQLTKPAPWVLRNAANARPVAFQAVYGPGRQHLMTVGRPGEGELTRVICGYFSFDEAVGEMFQTLLATEVYVRASDDSASRLRGVIRLIVEEAVDEQPGRTQVLQRLLEVMLIVAFRHRAIGGAPAERGLLAGLADTQIARAVRAVHAGLGRPWTVTALAKVAGMSRSAFAARFREVVGLAPADYLLQWRMALAANALRAGKQSLSEIASAAGYSSTHAFSAAFSRLYHSPPRAYARQLAVPPPRAAPSAATHDGTG